MTDRELMQMALDALDSDNPHIQVGAAITLRYRLAQPEPDAVLAEREACANVADIALLGCERSIRDRVVRAIRARGET